jgi:hypothetical protein
MMANEPDLDWRDSAVNSGMRKRIGCSNKKDRKRIFVMHVTIDLRL